MSVARVAVAFESKNVNELVDSDVGWEYIDGRVPIVAEGGFSVVRFAEEVANT